MSEDLLARIERDLCKMGAEIWTINGPVDTLLEKVTQLKAQLEVHVSLQATAELLQTTNKGEPLPNQQATKVKHFVRLTFQVNSRKPRKKNDCREDRYRRLRQLDCDALKLCGLSYTAEDIINISNAEFEILHQHVEDFVRHRNLSKLLYGPDVNKAVESNIENIDDNQSFNKFMQAHKKRKYDETESPHKAAQASVNCPTGAPEEAKGSSMNSYGDVYALDLVDAQKALSRNEDVMEIYLTIPYKENENKTAFLTSWVSADLGILLSKTGRLLAI
ncbi:hypothetical protein B0O99DRAFT_594716 [Bisporella sp. PMI_857]|nr:hypothetical protein B0O99DRAFT_594716 [Bisporella sp. PMI_857]